jgi:hypothetical protein
MIKTESPTNQNFFHLRLQSLRALCRRITSRDSLDMTLLIIAAGMGLLMTVGFTIPVLGDLGNQPALPPTVIPAESAGTYAAADNLLVIDNPIR